MISQMLMVTALVVGVGDSTKVVAQPQFIGRWEHRFEQDSVGDVLLLRLSDGNLQGEYLGMEREGEHGLFYSASRIKDLKISGTSLSFVVAERDLFSKRPRSADQARRWTQTNRGFTRSELHFQGRLENGVLKLNCKTRDGNCPPDQMIFRKTH